MKRLFQLVLAVIFVVVLIFPIRADMDAQAQDYDSPQSTLLERLKAVSIGTRKDDYTLYLARYQDVPKPEVEIKIQAADFVDARPRVEILNNVGGRAGKAVRTGEEGYIEWKVNIPTAGLYQVKVEYFPVKGRGAGIERELWINGAPPFFGAKQLLFKRVWTDIGPVQRDNRENDIRPRQVETPCWRESYLTDYMGYYAEPYHFYFPKGQNTIRLVAVKEPVIIGTITIHQKEETPSYNEYLKAHRAKGIRPTAGHYIKIQGESAQYRSEPTLYAIQDRTSPATEPYHPSKIRLNIIGGYRWNLPGQWITWRFEVPESGLYNIVLKVRQNMMRGTFTNRRLFVNEQVPFAEVDNLEFRYQNRWINYSLGEGEESYLFYLEKGENELRLEITLGVLREILRVAEDSLFQLNAAYRKMLMVTGPKPDPYRDYRLDKVMPDVIELLAHQSEVLGGLFKRLQEYTGQRGAQVAILDRLSHQLQDMVERPDTIPRRMQDLKNNVGALGTWILSMREQPLDIDYVVIASPGQKIPPADVGFFQKALHEIKAMVASFYEDYQSVGDVYAGDALKVWVQTGRDQAQILKQMIDDTFTPEYGIPVNLQHVQQGVLMPNVVAGTGPDVALQAWRADPVNYAIRNALVDLTQFPDFPEVEKWFHPSGLLPFRFAGGVYALPETQVFPLMFYRTDILEELGLEVPETWEDLFHMLPVIQKNYLDFGIPVATTLFPEIGMQAYCIFLYQRGGDLYLENGIASALDAEEAVEAFKYWTELYINYNLPLWYDFANRFRIGEMPIGISDHNTYNLLTVFAPEIRGLWSFAPVPGIRQPDGSINRSVASDGFATMMIKEARDKEAAWEFMKWWAGAEAQERFGLEMESLLGAAARHPTANMNAMAHLPWPTKDYKTLMEQWNWVKGLQEVPGGYFTPRHINNAFRRVVYSGEDPRETLLDYIITINKEITAKRLEFGLPTTEDIGRKETERGVGEITCRLNQ